MILARRLEKADACAATPMILVCRLEKAAARAAISVGTSGSRAQASRWRSCAPLPPPPPTASRPPRHPAGSGGSRQRVRLLMVQFYTGISKKI